MVGYRASVLKAEKEWGIVVHTYNPNTRESEAGRLHIPVSCLMWVLIWN